MLCKKCVCGSTGGDAKTVNKIPVLECNVCGVVRQPVDMSLEGLSDWYAEQYHDGKYTHDYKHDEEVAKTRLRAYQIPSGSMLLDVGCGNGAFVTQARRHGIHACGQELGIGSSKSPHTYEGPLESINFPTDHFDVVTLHDVLEHVPEPMVFLAEIRRILKQGGRLLLDFPHFWSDAGKHHWKPIEHLWMPTINHLHAWLNDAGFSVEEFGFPIPSKVVLDVRAPEEVRSTILVPPGIGDSYWSLVKMQGLIKDKGLGIPDVLIGTFDHARDRAIDFVRRAPFINAAGYHEMDRRDRTWREAYLQNGRTVFEDAYGCDFFQAYNGVMRFGATLEDSDPEYPTDWHYPMFESVAEKRFGAKMRRLHGDYLVGYFIDHGMYKHWLSDFPPSQIYQVLDDIAQRSGKKILLIGAKWDEQGLTASLTRMDGDRGRFVDMTAQTTLEECLGLLRASSGTIGYPSGITIVSAAYKVPTFMLWNKYFDQRFWRNACPTETYGKTYDFQDTKEATPDSIAGAFADLVGYSGSVEPYQPFEQKASVLYKPRDVSVTVACVLKTGGDFKAEHVRLLQIQVQEHLKAPHRFLCLTDDPGVTFCDTEPLTQGWDGWWSKIELFRTGVVDHKGLTLYFDLDTVITGDLSPLAEYPHDFSMLARFRDDSRCASGVMAWRGLHRYVYDTFRRRPHRFMREYDEPKQQDQAYIEDQVLAKFQFRPDIIQNIVKVQSYKNHIGPGNTPAEDTAVVCFHGQPRPWDVSEPWIPVLQEVPV